VPFRPKQPALCVSTLDSMTDVVSTVRRAARATPRQRESVRILVVDDDPGVIKVLRRILSAYEVITTTSARHALVQVSSGLRFDLILCDLMMPEMTGMQLHSAILDHFPDQAARMVFLTGGAFDREADAFLRSNGNLSIRKPFDNAELLDLVSENTC